MILRPTPSLPRKKATAVAAKKKKRIELCGELKKRQSKYEKEYAENSQKLTDPMQSRVQMGRSALESRTVARLMRVARLPCESELRKSASQPSTRDVG